MVNIVLNKDFIDPADGHPLELDGGAIVETIHRAFKVHDVTLDLAERIAATEGEDQNRSEDHRS